MLLSIKKITAEMKNRTKKGALWYRYTIIKTKWNKHSVGALYCMQTISLLVKSQMKALRLKPRKLISKEQFENKKKT